VAGTTFFTALTRGSPTMMPYGTPGSAVPRATDYLVSPFQLVVVLEIYQRLVPVESTLE
jgi:hypothetical protein